MPRRVWVEHRDKVDWKRNLLSMVLGQLPDQERREWLVFGEDEQGRRVEARAGSEAEAEAIRARLAEEAL